MHTTRTARRIGSAPVRAVVTVDFDAATGVPASLSRVSAALIDIGHVKVIESALSVCFHHLVTRLSMPMRSSMAVTLSEFTADGSANEGTSGGSPKGTDIVVAAVVTRTRTSGFSRATDRVADDPANNASDDRSGMIM